MIKHNKMEYVQSESLRWA